MHSGLRPSISTATIARSKMREQREAALFPTEVQAFAVPTTRDVNTLFTCMGQMKEFRLARSAGMSTAAP